MGFAFPRGSAVLKNIFAITYKTNNLKSKYNIKGEKIMANTPAELSYTKSHEWVKEENGLVVGLTDYAQSELGDIVFINLPEVGDDVRVGEAFADVESVKAVSDVFSPATGSVFEVNEALLDAPQLINEDPYGAWLIKIAYVKEMDELLDAAAYDAVCEAEEH